MNLFTTRTTTALALLVALALPTALAASPLRIDATAAPFADEIDAVGVDLAWDGALVLVLDAEGIGVLGDALVPVADADGLPTDALGRVVVDEAIARSGVVDTATSGALFVLDATDAGAVATAFADRLTDLGFDVDVASDGRLLTFAYEGHAYRATFATHETGVQVYLGAI